MPGLRFPCVRHVSGRAIQVRIRQQEPETFLPRSSQQKVPLRDLRLPISEADPCDPSEVTSQVFFDGRSCLLSYIEARRDSNRWRHQSRSILIASVPRSRRHWVLFRYWSTSVKNGLCLASVNQVST